MKNKILITLISLCFISTSLLAAGSNWGGWKSKGFLDAGKKVSWAVNRNNQTGEWKINFKNNTNRTIKISYEVLNGSGGCIKKIKPLSEKIVRYNYLNDDASADFQLRERIVEYVN